MRILLFSFLSLTLLMLPLGINANTVEGRWGGKYTKEKTIKKEFSVNSDAIFKVKNSYGNLNITSWDQNRVMIEVHIKTNGNNEDKVKERLEEIDVDFENTSNLVSAITRFGDRKNSWGWNWGKRNNVNVQVNYSIKLPVKNSVHISNDYGNIYLDRIDGHAKISCDYGKMEIGELRGRNNELRFDYTSRTSFEYIKSAEIIADYSGFTVEKAGDLTIKADYTNADVEQMGNLEYTSDYGSLEVGNVKNVRGSGSYISVKLGEVEGDANVVSGYGSLKIAKMTDGDLNVKSDYTGIKIGYAPDYYFDFEISTEYAGVSGKDNFEINISREKSREKYYKGYRGKPNSGNNVSITSDYGSITFYEN